MRYFFGFFVCFIGALAFALMGNDIPKDDAELSRIIDETASYAQKKYNLNLIGTGISCPGGVFLSQDYPLRLIINSPRRNVKKFC